MIVHEALGAKSIGPSVSPAFLTYLQQRDPTTLTPAQVRYVDAQGNEVPPPGIDAQANQFDTPFPVLGYVGIGAGVLVLLGGVTFAFTRHKKPKAIAGWHRRGRRGRR